MEKTFFPSSLQPVFDDIIYQTKKSLDVDFILLAGSFSKGSWLFDGDNLMSDIEIVFISNSKWSNQKKKRLVSDLNNRHSYKIELKGFLRSRVEKKVISNYSFSNPGYISLNFFDVFHNPKYLYKKDNDKLNITTENNEVPAWEAWRLYVNRMADILKLDSKENKIQKNQYYWLKMMESTADSYLIVNGLYEKEIQCRLDMFTQSLLDSDESLNTECKKSWSLIHNALESRINHKLSDFEIKLDTEEFKLVVNHWMEYFEQKVAEQERLSIDNKFDFYRSYFDSSHLQKKYLDFSNGLNIQLSNLLKLVLNRSLIHKPFNPFSINKSWRHTILITVALLFYEESNGERSFKKSRMASEKIMKKGQLDQLNSNDFINTVLNYWGMTR